MAAVTPTPTSFLPSDTSHLNYDPAPTVTATLPEYDQNGDVIQSKTKTVVYNGFLNALAGSFEGTNEQANIKMTVALNALKQNPSDPTLLANYQSCLSQYTLLRNAESTVVKTYKDIGSSILGNYR